MEKSKEYIASFSGGKDSAATIILAHEDEPLDLIIFAEVMFDNDTSGELPEHIQFIENKCKPLFESWGYEVKTLHADKTFMDCFNHVITKGPREGMRVGFPMAGKCCINRDCKVGVIKQFLREKDPEKIMQYLGIAADEPKRLARLEGTNKISLLAKYGHTEKMAFELCEKYGLLSPIYDFAPRGGCWFCPNAGYFELKHLRTNYPKLWERLMDLENEKSLAGPIWNGLTKRSMRDNEEMFYWEEAQMTIYDFLED